LSIFSTDFADPGMRDISTAEGELEEVKDIGDKRDKKDKR
jgi:hypothetical protein